MALQGTQSGLKASLLIAIVVIMFASLAVIVLSSKTSNQDLRSHAMYPTTGGDTCGVNKRPKPICYGANSIAVCQWSGWVCVRGTPTTAVTEIPTKTPTPTPTKLKDGMKCTKCYDDCDGGVGSNGVCWSREHYCKVLRSPFKPKDVFPIECQ